MSKVRYTVETALLQLERCHVKVSDKQILIPRANPPGIKPWGAIDYLRTKGFTITHV